MRKRVRITITIGLFVISLLFGCVKELESKTLTREIKDEIESVIKDAFSPRADVTDFVYDPQEISAEAAVSQINVSFTIANVRAPEDNPVIIGMYRAKEEYATEEEKAAAQKVIDGYLLEMDKVGYTSRWLTKVKVYTDSDEHFELRCVLIYDDSPTEVPLSEYFKKENTEERIQLGIDTLKRDMKSAAFY